MPAWFCSSFCPWWSTVLIALEYILLNFNPMKTILLTLTFLLNCYLSFSQSLIALEPDSPKSVETKKTENIEATKPDSISLVETSKSELIEAKSAVLEVEVAKNSEFKSDSVVLQNIETADVEETSSSDLKETENTDIKATENINVDEIKSADLKEAEDTESADLKTPANTEIKAAVNDSKPVEAVESVEPVKTMLRTSDYKGLVEAYTEEILRNPDSVATLASYTGRAKANIELKNYKEAIADCNTVLNKDRINEDALFNRGFAKMKSRDFRGGLNDLNKLVKMNPANQQALFYRAVCKSYLFDNKGAIKDYTTVLALDPTNTNVIFERAVLKYESYDTKGAIADWYKIADKDPRAAKAIKKYSKELAKY